MTPRIVLAIYPFLIAAYPILSMFAANGGAMRESELVVPLAVLWGATLTILALTFILTRRLKKAALYTAMVLIAFFTARPIYDCILPLLGKGSGAEALSLTCILLMLAQWATIRIAAEEKRALALSYFLAAASVTTILIVLGTSLWKHPKAYAFSQPSKALTDMPLKPGRRPDIYYIILDGYGRSDTLREIYGFDNSHFDTILKANGFYVASRATANYGQTLLSLASSLNMQYLDPLARGAPRSRNLGPVQQFLFRSKVPRYLRSIGYTFVHIPSGYAGTDQPYSDIEISPPFALTEFHHLLLAETIIPVVMRRLPLNSYRNFQYEEHRRRIRYALNELPKVPSLPSPKFVFAHILAPHPPFVFDAQGNPVNPAGKFHLQDASILIRSTSADTYKRAYRDQVTYITRRMEEVVQELVREAPDALIIIQSDHGPGSQLNWNDVIQSNAGERMRILNAYRVPEEVRAELYEEISPVNTFRLIFRRLFEAPLPPASDKSFLSSLKSPYLFHDVTEKAR